MSFVYLASFNNFGVLFTCLDIFKEWSFKIVIEKNYLMLDAIFRFLLQIN